MKKFCIIVSIIAAFLFFAYTPIGKEIGERVGKIAGATQKEAKNQAYSFTEEYSKTYK